MDQTLIQQCTINAPKMDIGQTCFGCLGLSARPLPRPPPPPPPPPPPLAAAPAAALAAAFSSSVQAFFGFFFSLFVAGRATCPGLSPAEAEASRSMGSLSMIASSCARLSLKNADVAAAAGAAAATAAATTPQAFHVSSPPGSSTYSKQMFVIQILQSVPAYVWAYLVARSRYGP